MYRRGRQAGSLRFATKETFDPMNHFIKIAAAGLLGVAGVIGAVSMRPANAGPLETQAIEALFPGTFAAEVHGYQVSFTAHQDGSLVGKSRQGTDTGQWSVQSGQLCIMMSSWLNGRTACSQVVQQGDWYRADNVVFRKL
jgi:hypothetical protein